MATTVETELDTERTLLCKLMIDVLVMNQILKRLTIIIIDLLIQ